MDLKKIRKIHGINPTSAARRISPHLKGYAFDEEFLERYENGDLSSERASAISEAVKKAFPEYNENFSNAKKQKTIKVNWRAVFLATLFLFCAAIVSAFAIFKDHPRLEEFEKLLGVVATLITIIGFVLGLNCFKSK